VLILVEQVTGEEKYEVVILNVSMNRSSFLVEVCIVIF
jgi:hypothetical protein